jgi:hypothetical protein
MTVVVIDVKWKIRPPADGASPTLLIPKVLQLLHRHALTMGLKVPTSLPCSVPGDEIEAHLLRRFCT